MTIFNAALNCLKEQFNKNHSLDDIAKMDATALKKLNFSDFPDLRDFSKWGQEKGNMKDYIRLLRDVYEPLRKANAVPPEVIKMDQKTKKPIGYKEFDSVEPGSKGKTIPASFGKGQVIYTPTTPGYRVVAYPKVKQYVSVWSE